MGREVAVMRIPIADDFAAIATGIREDAPADREAPATAEEIAALKFAAGVAVEGEGVPQRENSGPIR
jgi:hypothetical protein